MGRTVEPTQAVCQASVTISTPAITVIVPVHNNAAGVRRTLGAVGAGGRARAARSDRRRRRLDRRHALYSPEPGARFAATRSSRRRTRAPRRRGTPRHTRRRVTSSCSSTPTTSRSAAGWPASLASSDRASGSPIASRSSRIRRSIANEHGFLLPGTARFPRAVLDSLGGYDPQLRFADDLDPTGHASCAPMASGSPSRTRPSSPSTTSATHAATTLTGSTR